MSEFDLAPLRASLTKLGPQGRQALLPALHAAQALYGFIPALAAAEIGRSLGVPLADVFGVIEFYDLFSKEPVGRKVVRVCGDPTCAMAGGREVLETLCHRLGIQEGQVTTDNAYSVERSPCLGLCEHAPAALVGDTAIGNISPDDALEILTPAQSPLGSLIGGSSHILTANCGKGRPTSIKEYIAGQGYAAFEKALLMGSEAVIAEIKASGLVGRGGAAFPTGVKWEGAAKAPGMMKYVVCNADESEPGTFKDRVLLEEDPHRILEGMLIAAYAVGSAKGYIYIRGEYPYAYDVVSQALDEASENGFLGGNIRGSGFGFDIELQRGAGAYICGEETALFESIEGKRGFPREKPPYPTTHGLFNLPTVINNVETLSNVPGIILKGAAEYRRIGTDDSPGSKLFCVSGDVVKPGLYEVPFGITIRELIYDLAGGMRSDAGLQAVLFGGAAGAFATPAQLDTRLSFEDLKRAGLPLGSGVVLAIDQSRDLREILRLLARFFAHESCGKCYPCQLGTQRQYEILERVAQGNILPGDAGRLADVGWTMVDASLCGLGQTAATAVLSALSHWPALFHASSSLDDQ